ncbi:shikimate dehydrogenase [candidate division KSB1 bacterium]|nr:shikimate dehydrogenase [candidate division KSB1 bacterium]
MKSNYKSELVGVFGHPVAENPTIIMQEAAFQDRKLNWRYLTIEVYPEDLKDAMRGLRAMNMRGINLTIPHKVEVLKYLDKIAPDAALIGAVNTVRLDGHMLIGENTDGKGFLQSIKLDAQMDPVDKNVVILGAGGAARAICVELALAGVKKITIVNRTAARGKELVNLIKNKTKTSAVFVEWDTIFTVPEKTDILVNATSIGLYPDVESKPNIEYTSITKHMFVCDVIPNPPLTRFLKEAELRGAKTLDGLGMLVYQGAIGFEMWTGVNAPVDVMHKALRDVFVK